MTCWQRAFRFGLSLVILAVAAAMGRGLVWLLGWPIPSSLLGMVVLLVALLFGVIKLRWIEPGATLLLAVMAVFFVPSAVGVVNHLEVITREWAPLLVGSVIATLVVLTVVGVSEQRNE